jgi:hypothetical protein
MHTAGANGLSIANHILEYSPESMLYAPLHAAAHHAGWFPAFLSTVPSIYTKQACCGIGQVHVNLQSVHMHCIVRRCAHTAKSAPSCTGVAAKRQWGSKTQRCSLFCLRFLLELSHVHQRLLHVRHLHIQNCDMHHMEALSLSLSFLNVIQQQPPLMHVRLTFSGQWAAHL